MFAVSFVKQLDAHAVVQKREFADTLGERFKFVFHRAKGVFAGEKLHARAVAIFRLRCADDFERFYGFAALEFDKMLFAFAPNSEFEPIRQRVDYAHAHTVQAA